MIISVVLTTILLVLVVVVAVVPVTICWGICLLIFVFTFGGNFGNANLNCFARDPVPPEPAPLPTVIITEPPGGGAPPRYHTPTDLITFTAVAADVDGSPLTGPSVEWFDSYPGVPDQTLGQGEEISVMLTLRPEDAQAGHVTEHLVSVVATGAGGTKSRPARTSVNIRPGIG